MKQFFTIGLFVVAALWAFSATAEDTTTDASSPATPCCDEQARQVALKALPDPSRFKDDICWVAPEWQDH